MRDGWRQVTLGEICTLTKGTTPTQKAVPGPYPLVVTAADFLSSDAYQFEGEAVCVPMVSSTGHGHASLKRVHYASGKFAVANIITALEAKPDAAVDMRYLWLVLDHGRADIIVPLMKGTANVSLSQRALSGARIALPPLDEQRRIVDLIGALDEVIQASEAEEAAASASRGYLLSGLLARLDDKGELRALGELGTFVRGRRFTKNDYVEEGLGCVHYGQLYTHLGSVTTDPLTFVPDIMRSRLRLASRGDVIVAATSENIEDLGKATVWMGEGEVAVHDDCQIFRHALDPRFAAHLFATKSFQDQKVQFAAGTKVTRISGDSLAKIVVPVPSPERQATIGEAMSDLDTAIEALVTQRNRLQCLRADLLTVLMSGEHEIPASYDELLEAS